MPLHIPKFWASATASARNPRGEDVPLRCFGHADSGIAEARGNALEILSRLTERVRAGAPWPERYGYGDRPIREEILRELRSPSHSPDGYVTRNGYGAAILNSASVLFADIDDVPLGFVARVRRLFGGGASSATPDEVPDSITAFAAAHPTWTLRVYRTYAGWRVLALHGVFDPESQATIEALRAMGSDPQYVRLTTVQKCFRARLTPKPWRCGVARPQRVFPREDPLVEQDHARWCAAYEAACRQYATCRFVTELGRSRRCADAERIVTIHDEATRAEESLPLA